MNKQIVIEKNRKKDFFSRFYLFSFIFVQNLFFIYFIIKWLVDRQYVCHHAVRNTRQIKLDMDPDLS